MAESGASLSLFERVRIEPLVGERPQAVARLSRVPEYIALCRKELSNAGHHILSASAFDRIFSFAEDNAIGFSKSGSVAEHRFQIDFAVSTAEALMYALKLGGADEPINRILKSEFDRNMGQRPQGLDALWELVLANKLHLSGMEVKFLDPPDLEVCHVRGLSRYGIACKKIYKKRNIGSQLDKAVKQLKPYEGAGLVAFNIDALLPHQCVLQSPNFKAASGFLQQKNETFIEQNQKKFQNAVLGGGCDGVLVSASVLADVSSSVPRFNRITAYTIWSVKEVHPSSLGRLEVFESVLPSQSVEFAIQ